MNCYGPFKIKLVHKLKGKVILKLVFKNDLTQKYVLNKMFGQEKLIKTRYFKNCSPVHS